MEEQRIKSMLAEPDLEFRDAPPSRELSVDEYNKLALIDEANRMAVIHNKNPDNMTIEDIDISLRRMSNLFQNPIAEPERVAIRNQAIRTTPVEEKQKEKLATGGLTGGQKELDKNNDGDITGEDFAMLREEREKKGLGGILTLVSKSFAKRNPDAVLKVRGIDDKFAITNDITELKKLSPEDAKEALNYFKSEKLNMKQEFKERGRLDPSDADYYGEAERKRIFSEIDKDFEKQFEVLNSIIKREKKVFGGILVKPITKMISSLLKKNKNTSTDSIKVSDAQLDKLQKQIDEGADLTGTSAEEVANLTSQMSQDANALRARGFNDKRIEELLEEAYILGESKDLELALQQPIRIKKQKGGMMMDDQMDSMMQREETPDMENQMADMMPEKTAEEMVIEESQVPDEMMEDNYIDFLIDEALDEEEETMLMQELEANPQLSMLFDKVMEVAMEFSGSGPVEGPGSEVSDSIPARLSDGEFVFTAKAVEVLGADNLMSLMKQAEAQAEGRQMAQDGGLMEEEDTVMPVQQEPVRQEIRVTKETVGTQASMQEEDDLVGDEIKKSMLSGRPHVRS